MKLKYFSEQTLPKLLGQSNVAARVSFNKAGTISFNGPAVTLMKIKGGDKITLAQDEEDKKNWYFFKDNEHGFKIRDGYDSKGALFNHAMMVKTFNKCFGLDDDETRNYLLAGQPTLVKGSKTEYWCILVNTEPVEEE